MRFGFSPSCPEHEYTFSGLSKIKDKININIFDEFMIEKHEVMYDYQLFIHLLDLYTTLSLKLVLIRDIQF